MYNPSEQPHQICEWVLPLSLPLRLCRRLWLLLLLLCQRLWLQMCLLQSHSQPRTRAKPRCAIRSAAKRNDTAHRCVGVRASKVIRSWRSQSKRALDRRRTHAHRRAGPRLRERCLGGIWRVVTGGLWRVHRRRRRAHARATHTELRKEMRIRACMLLLRAVPKLLLWQPVRRWLLLLNLLDLLYLLLYGYGLWLGRGGRR